MSYRTWMNVAPDGSIVSVVWRLGEDAPADHPVLCTNPELDPQLRKDAGLNLYYDGKHVRRRRPVRWHATPKAVAAVGETISLQLAGLPAEHRTPVRVRVGEQAYTLEHPYLIELGWENPARVSVQVDEPTLMQSSFVNVQFVERRQKP